MNSSGSLLRCFCFYVLAQLYFRSAKQKKKQRICPMCGYEPVSLSARAYHRILKLACTIADLAGSASIQQAHIAEALQ